MKNKKKKKKKTHLSEKQDKSHRENYSNILIEKLVQIDRKSLQIRTFHNQFNYSTNKQTNKQAAKWIKNTYFHSSGITQKQSDEQLVLLLNHRKYNR